MAWLIEPELLIERLVFNLGIPLSLIEESCSIYETATGTATGTLQLSAELHVDVVIKLLMGEPEKEPRIWALVFFFIAGKRVAPANYAYMTYFYSEENEVWNFNNWEADVYEEWDDVGDHFLIQ